MPADPDQVVAVIIAAALTLIIFNIGGAVLAWVLWRIERRTRVREPGVPPKRDPLAPLYYVMSSLLWPASLALCLVFIGKAQTSRMGAICGTLGIAQVMVIAWLVCSAFALFARDIAPWLP